MTPEKARNILENYLCLKNGKLPIWDEIVLTDYHNGQLSQWTFRALIQIAYKF